LKSGAICRAGGTFYQNSWRFDALVTAKTSKRREKYMRNHKRATVYFSADTFKALRMRAAATQRSMSALVDEAVKDALAEDEADFNAFTLLREEPSTTLDSFVAGLRRRGAL
jgi:hypothetical protein